MKINFLDELKNLAEEAEYYYTKHKADQQKNMQRQSNDFHKKNVQPSYRLKRRNFNQFNGPQNNYRQRDYQSYESRPRD